MNPSNSVPFTLYTPRFPRVDGLSLHGRKWYYLLSKYTLCLFSLLRLLPPKVSGYSHEPNFIHCCEEFKTDKLMTCEWRELMSNTLVVSLNNYCQNAREEGIELQTSTVKQLSGPLQGTVAVLNTSSMWMYISEWMCTKKKVHWKYFLKRWKRKRLKGKDHNK